jgi:hypothetical protein
MDAGKQTRLLAFGAPRQPAGEATLQGTSVAQWQSPQITRFYYVEDQRAGSRHSRIPRANPGRSGAARHAQARRHA